MTISFSRPVLSVLLRPTAIALAGILASTMLSGCVGPRALRQSYVAYAESFATASNQQLLLNLARLRNEHPPHFLQMGGVTAQFDFRGGLTGGYVNSDNIITRTLGLSLGGSESPVFSFTPLSGSAYSEMLLTPFDSKVLYSYANQNLPVSITVRLLVDQIKLKYENGVRASFRNRIFSGNFNNYGDFLRLASLLEQLHAEDLVGIEADKSGTLQFSLNSQARSRMRNLIDADPRFRLVSFDPHTGRGTARISIVTRSFLNVLLSTAWEARNFDNFSDDFLNSLPKGVQHPVLRIDDDPAYTEPAAAEIKYAGKRYVVSDRPGSADNRIAFTLLQLLASQTQLDPSKLPTQQLIQVR